MPSAYIPSNPIYEVAIICKNLLSGKLFFFYLKHFLTLSKLRKIERAFLVNFYLFHVPCVCFSFFINEPTPVSINVKNEVILKVDILLIPGLWDVTKANYYIHTIPYH